MSLPPWADQLIALFKSADERAIALARSLTAAQLNWSPRPGAWGVGQCLDHLRVANVVYLGAMAPALAGRSPAPVQEITPGWFGRWFIRTAIDASPAMKSGKAPRKIVPVERVDGAVLDQFLSSNEQAREFVRKASQYDVNRIRFQNPFVPIIYFTVGTGLEILTRHQNRHLLQAERVRESPDFRA